VRRALLLGLVLSLAGASCGHRGPAAPPPSLPSPPATDVPPPDFIPGAFAVRQKVTARSRQGGGSFEAVLQRQPGKLILLGLTPYGSRGFLLEQTASDLKFTSYLPRDLPFPPTFMLLDVYRVFGQWLGPPLLEGGRAGVVRAELVHERWRGGVLLERTFGPAAGGLAPTTTIAYEGRGPSGLPAHVVLTNTRFGYTLEIETLPL
jgi:hypothetical protein